MNSPFGFLNIAHRGASEYAPENTFAAFDKALDMGVNHVELDVHFSRDGHIVVIHDDTLDRTTDGSGPVAGLTLSELRKLDAGSWFGAEYAGERIRSLAELFERYKGRLHFHIEIKARPALDTGARAEGLASRVADLVRAYGLTGDVTITSFWRPWLDEVREYAPELATGWLVPLGPVARDDFYMSSFKLVEQASALGLDQVCPRANITTPELVSALHERGFVVRCHGVYSEQLMRHVVDCGADGMTVNFPDKLKEYLDSNPGV